MGANDGVQPEDGYTVYGRPQADGVSQTVDSWVTLGECIVPRYEGVDATRSRCHMTAGAIGRADFEAGGYVKAVRCPSK